MSEDKKDDEDDEDLTLEEEVRRAWAEEFAQDAPPRSRRPRISPTSVGEFRFWLSGGER